MKKISTLVLFLLVCMTGFSENWIAINSTSPSPAKIKMESSTIERSVVHFSIDGFTLKEVMTSQGVANIVSLGKSTPVQMAGAPDLPKLTTSLVIPDIAGMGFRVLSSTYKDFENIQIAPSKGIITRDIDPSTIPYQYGNAYMKDQFFPGNLVETREPFIVRELRGQTLLIYPFQYNPVTKKLRVWYDLTVELYKNSEIGTNTLTGTSPKKIDRYFSGVYSNEFLNYDAVSYTPLNDYGKMLVISYGSFMNAMQPYVKWKNQSGIPTVMVDVATIGTTAASIKS
ncbi:MAG: C25 family peptidase propeptide domain-containing protein, partial [Bacteroidota bacterium]